MEGLNGSKRNKTLATVIETHHGSQGYWYRLLLSIYGMAVMLTERSLD